MVTCLVTVAVTRAMKTPLTAIILIIATVVIRLRRFAGLVGGGIIIGVRVISGRRGRRAWKGGGMRKPVVCVFWGWPGWAVHGNKKVENRTT